MKCNDCLHKNVCRYYPVDSLPPLIRESIFKKLDAECQDFKDKSKIVELPCKAGDLVYTQNPYAPADFIPKDKEIEQWKVNHIGITLNCRGWGKLIGFNDIGKTVFLTREEAEQAAKELGKLIKDDDEK